MSALVPETKPEEIKTQAQTQPVTAAEPAVQETDKDVNWKKFKEAREQDRKRAEENAKRAEEKQAENEALKAALDAVLNKPQTQQQQYQSNQGYDQEETEDQRIERKVQESLAKRQAEQDRQRAALEEQEMPNRLKNMHKDFDQVCSPGNLDYLEYHHPELARSLGSRPQSIDKWNDIYNVIKRYIPNVDSKKDQEKAAHNFNKPQSMSAPVTTQNGQQITNARELENRRAENWARMQKTLKRVDS